MSCDACAICGDVTEFYSQAKKAWLCDKSECIEAQPYPEKGILARPTAARVAGMTGQKKPSSAHRWQPNRAQRRAMAAKMRRGE